MGYRYFNK